MNSRTGNLVGAILLLAAFALLGVRSSLAVAGTGLSAGARAVSLLQWWYAVLAVLAIIGLLLRHGGTRLVLFAWAALFVTRNALTPVYLGWQGPRARRGRRRDRPGDRHRSPLPLVPGARRPGQLLRRVSADPDLPRIPVRVRAADGTARDDGWIRVAHRPVAKRFGEAALIAGAGTLAGVLLLPVPLVHIFGILFMLTTWWFAVQRARTEHGVVSAGGTCPRCAKEGRFFVGFGRKRYPASGLHLLPLLRPRPDTRFTTVSLYDIEVTTIDGKSELRWRHTGAACC